jgi:hypothetical protein
VLPHRATAIAKTIYVRVGQKFIHKSTNTIYIVKNIQEKQIILVREDGIAAMLVQEDVFITSSVGPIYD